MVQTLPRHRWASWYAGQHWTNSHSRHWLPASRAVCFKCLLQATRGQQLIISVSNYTRKGFSPRPRTTVYQTTSAETSAWSIITAISNSRFKEEGWCGLLPVSDVVCDQPFPVEINKVQSSKPYRKSGAAKAAPAAPLPTAMSKKRFAPYEVLMH